MSTKTPDDIDRLLTRTQLADALKVSLVTVDNWTRKGIPCEIQNGKRLFPFGKALLWRGFYDLRTTDREFDELMKQPLRAVLHSFSRAHGEVLASVTLNGHPRATEIREKLRDISGLVADIHDLA